MEDQARDALHTAVQDRLAADAEAAPLVSALREAEARLQAAENGSDATAVDQARSAVRASKEALAPHRARIAEDPGLAPLRDAFAAAAEAKRTGQSTPEIVALRAQADADNQAYKAAVRERLAAIPEAAAALEALAAMP